MTVSEFKTSETTSIISKKVKSVKSLKDDNQPKKHPMDDMSQDTLMLILGNLDARTAEMFSIASKSYNNVVNTNSFLKSLSFSKILGKPQIKKIQQHSNSLEFLQVPSLEQIAHIKLPNLKILIINPTNNSNNSNRIDNQDFTNCESLEILGICDLKFPKVDELKIPNSLKTLYTTFELTKDQIKDISSSENMQGLKVYYNNGSIATNETFVNVSDVEFIKRWIELKNKIDDCYNITIHNLNMENFYNNYDVYSDVYSDDETDSDDEGDYNLEQYNQNYQDYEEDYRELYGIDSDEEGIDDFYWH